MIQIRENVFETNSSSSHSLVIKPGCDYYTPEEVFEELKWLCREVKDKPGKYILEPWGHEFDEGFNRAPFKVLDDFRNKMWYLYAHAPSRHYAPDKKHPYGRWTTEYYKVTNYLKKHLPWIERMQKKYGVVAEEEQAETIVKREVGEIFSQVLEDAGVYKNTPEGITAFDRFMLTAGCLRK